MLILNALLQAQMIRPIDFAFGEFIAKQTTQHSEFMGVLGALISHRLGAQDSCVAIDHIGQPFAGVFTFPEVEDIRSVLSQSEVVSCDGINNAHLPLIFEHDRLYLQRYWQYERRLANSFLARAKRSIQLDMVEAKRLV